MQELATPRHRAVSARLYDEGVERRSLFGAPRFLRWMDIVDVRYSASEALLIGRDVKVRIVYGQFRDRDEVARLLDTHVPREAVESLLRRERAAAEKYASGLKGWPLIFVICAGILPAFLAGRLFLPAVRVVWPALAADWGELVILAAGSALWYATMECWMRSKTLGAVAQAIVLVMAWFGQSRPWELLGTIVLEIALWAIGAMLMRLIDRSHSH